MQGWKLVETRFYTGIPDVRDNAFWNRFWAAKLALMGARGVHTLSRPLRYASRLIVLPDGRTVTARVGQEKGIDIRIALEVCRLTRENICDVALMFSQDQDLSEVVEEVRLTQRQQDRWIKLASAFPVSPTSRSTRGINGTDWIRIDRATYDACLDPNDYRSASKRAGADG